MEGWMMTDKTLRKVTVYRAYHSTCIIKLCIQTGWNISLEIIGRVTPVVLCQSSC